MHDGYAQNVRTYGFGLARSASVALKFDEWQDKENLYKVRPP
jgi:hypothetical protein